MKVYELTEGTWWAAETLEEAVQDAMNTMGLSREDAVDSDAHELTPEEMEYYRYQDEDEEESITFKAQLERMIAREVHFPCFFATSEY